MKAVTFHGRRDVRVDTVPDPTIEQPTDAIVRITSSGICGSDLHLYEVLGPLSGWRHTARPSGSSRSSWRASSQTSSRRS